jgi:glycosyltransferase involved in cell wall biosynthesis
MTVKFSVLSATMNCLTFVGEMMRSVLAQDYDNWEHIIVDDCSSDRTYKRACEIAAKHKNITVIRNDQRLYCGSNYNKILSMATGKYCGILDGDDKLRPDAISTIVKLYEANENVDFIWTNHRWGNTKMLKFRDGLSRMAKKGTIYDSEGNDLKHVYSHWRTFKTEMRDRGKLFRKLKCTVDKDLGYTLEELGQGAFYRDSLYLYRYHNKNMSHNSSQKSMWKEIRKYHKNKHRPFKIIELRSI